MNTKKFVVVASLIFTLMSALGTVRQAQSQGDKPSYPKMAPLEQYLMDRDAEINLARSAAPEAISRNAKIMVLGRHGYDTAVEGTNGWVCAVERGFTNDLFDDPEFWSPRIRGANCYNPPAARSVVPIVELRARMVLDGLSKEQIKENLKAALSRKELPALEGGAMSYMMSKQAYLTDADDHNMSHLMIYAPLTDAASWGADLPKSPVMFGGLFQGTPEPITVFLVPVGKWSDGSPAPMATP